ncbi:hypothetical protein ABIF68_007258 [Bradyrhizobium japonicum]
MVARIPDYASLHPGYTACLMQQLGSNTLKEIPFLG